MKLEELIDKIFLILPFLFIGFIVFYVFYAEFTCSNFSIGSVLQQEMRKNPPLLG